MHRKGRRRDARVDGGLVVRENVGGAWVVRGPLDRSPKVARGAGGALAWGLETSEGTGKGIDKSSGEGGGGVRDLEVGGMEGVLAESTWRSPELSNATLKAAGGRRPAEAWSE